MDPSERRVWVVAILLFGVGDVVTTAVLISGGVGVEGNPIVSSAIDELGLWILAPWKAVAIAGFVAISRAVPRPHNVGVPIGLALLGALLVAWNSVGALIGRNPVPIF